MLLSVSHFVVSRSRRFARCQPALGAVATLGFLASAVAACGGPHVAGSGDATLSVVKGTDLSLSEVQALGLVAVAADTSRSDRRGYCSATLVSPRKLLSAAHCLANPLGAPALAVFGTDAFAQGNPTVGIESWDRHRTADLVIFTLSGDAPKAWRMQPLALDPKALPVTLGGAAAFGAGFGRAATGTPLTGGIARRGNTVFSMFDRGSPLAIVNSGSGRGFCSGDSGGPLWTSVGGRTLVVGVLSQGASTCETGLDNYVSVPTYADWISPRL
jgi:hypothetical protein